MVKFVNIGIQFNKFLRIQRIQIRCIEGAALLFKGSHPAVAGSFFCIIKLGNSPVCGVRLGPIGLAQQVPPFETLRSIG